MGVTAVVMAGGKGSRMKLPEEKPLVKVDGKSMIEHVLAALKNAKRVDEIVVAVSKHTPETAKAMEGSSVKVVKTPGKGYVSDTQYAIKKLKLNTVLTISADLPLVTSEIVDEVVEHYETCSRPALAVMVPAETRQRLGLQLEAKGLVPAGINVIDGRRIDEGELEEEVFVIDSEDVAVNVNTLKDLAIAECRVRAIGAY